MTRKKPKYSAGNRGAIETKVVPASGDSASDHYVSQCFRWDPSRACLDHSQFGMEQVPHEDLWGEVLVKLQHFSSMTWQDILRASGGRRVGNNNHHLNPETDLTKEGQAALNSQDLELREMPLFSLRLEGKRRVLGFRQGSTFFPVWHDLNHRFASTKG